MSVILMTTLFYKALILKGEIWPWEYFYDEKSNSQIILNQLYWVLSERFWKLNHAKRDIMAFDAIESSMKWKWFY